MKEYLIDRFTLPGDSGKWSAITSSSDYLFALKSWERQGLVELYALPWKDPGKVWSIAWEKACTYCNYDGLWVSSHRMLLLCSPGCRIRQKTMKLDAREWHLGLPDWWPEKVFGACTGTEGSVWTLGLNEDWNSDNPGPRELVLTCHGITGERVSHTVFSVPHFENHVDVRMPILVCRHSVFMSINDRLYRYRDGTIDSFGKELNRYDLALFPLPGDEYGLVTCTDWNGCEFWLNLEKREPSAQVFEENISNPSLITHPGGVAIIGHDMDIGSNGERINQPGYNEVALAMYGYEKGGLKRSSLHYFLDDRMSEPPFVIKGDSSSRFATVVHSFKENNVVVSVYDFPDCD